MVSVAFMIDGSYLLAGLRSVNQSISCNDVEVVSGPYLDRYARKNSSPTQKGQGRWFWQRASSAEGALGGGAAP